MELVGAGSIEASEVKELYQGSQTVTVAAGKALRMETTPGGAEILDIETAAGKSRQYTIYVTCVETDA
jgi:hypothetical protein